MDSNYTLENINATASTFLTSTAGFKVIAFHGEMGSGKTTFIKAVCAQLGVLDPVSSPTYSIINEYKTNGGTTVYHLDLYRLKSEEEAVLAGVEECFYSGNYCFVEWPENAPSLLPDQTLHCYLASSSDSERNLKIKM